MGLIAAAIGLSACAIDDSPLEAVWSSACYVYSPESSTLQVTVEFDACIQPGCEQMLKSSCEVTQNRHHANAVEIAASATLGGSSQRGQCGSECTAASVTCTTTVDILPDNDYVTLRGRWGWSGSFTIDGTEQTGCLYYDEGDYS